MRFDSETHAAVNALFHASPLNSGQEAKQAALSQKASKIGERYKQVTEFLTDPRRTLYVALFDGFGADGTLMVQAIEPYQRGAIHDTLLELSSVLLRKQNQTPMGEQLASVALAAARGATLDDAARTVVDHDLEARKRALAYGSFTWRDEGLEDQYASARSLADVIDHEAAPLPILPDES